jgi:hypothetical protein
VVGIKAGASQHCSTAATGSAQQVAARDGAPRAGHVGREPVLLQWLIVARVASCGGQCGGEVLSTLAGRFQHVGAATAALLAALCCRHQKLSTWGCGAKKHRVPYLRISYQLPPCVVKMAA